MLDAGHRRAYFHTGWIGGLIGLPAIVAGAMLKKGPSDWLLRTDNFLPIARLSELEFPKLALIAVPDLSDAADLANAFAPEHLQLFEEDAVLLAERIRTAGCVFAGRYGATAFGDYAAGSNHVLPTGGCARHSSGLSVQTFLRGVQLIEYDEAALRDVSGHVVALANAEDLPAHGEAVTARFGGAVPGPDGAV